MIFDDVRFPTNISRGSTGGPERRTDVVLTASGREERNQRWAHSRRKYAVGFGVKSLADIRSVLAFFEERRGRLHAFRFKDHSDFKSNQSAAATSATDQMLGTGDGVTANFQLVKTYGAGNRSYTRNILAPVTGTLKVAVSGTLTNAYTVNVAIGVITFNGGSIPPIGAAVTAGFEFDVPVRFDTDELSINLSHFEAGALPEIPLIEVR